MKKKDVKIGETYVAKVSGILAPVKILGENRYGGWDGMNVRTGRPIRIKSAQRLRRVLGDKQTEGWINVIRGTNQ